MLTVVGPSTVIELTAEDPTRARVDLDTAAIPTRLLVLGMAREDGTIEAGALYEVAEACGQTPEQVRSCLRRLVAEGLFERDGEGRVARFVPTPTGRARLDLRVERTRRAFVQDAAGRGWDGVWHLAAFAIPETERSSRHALRDRLVRLGGAAIHGGVYVSPHRWEADVRAAATELGASGYLTVASTSDLEVGGVRDPRTMAARLWPLDELAGRYAAFVDCFRGVPEQLERARRSRERLSEASFFSLALRMFVALHAAARTDPLLPPELLPRPWPGRAARELAMRSRRLALLARSDGCRPALFRSFDEVIEGLPPR
jgi:phenylacetic acid degradation operon negative regulatory protein